MARYRLTIKPSAAKEIEAIVPKKDRQRIVRCISELAENPFPPGAQKLSGQRRYRIRWEKYRILYEVDVGELVVLVVKVGHRTDVYR